MVINDILKTEEFLRSKLLHAYIDCFRVYSIELQVNFLKQTDTEIQSCWLSVMEGITVTDSSEGISDSGNVLTSLHGLIGDKVGSVEILANGSLSIAFGSKVLKVFSDEPNFEMVWKVTPETPEPYAKHPWSVTFTDRSELVIN